MDVMQLRRNLLMQLIGGGDMPIPSFMNHIEGGSFTLTSADVSQNGDYDVQLTQISVPKGVLIFSNAFNSYDNKADKPLLGALSALYIRPNDSESERTTNGWIILSDISTYIVNWGSGTNQANPTGRIPRNEGQRGVYLYNESTKMLRFRGFSSTQNEYDFKYNVTYNWIAWD